MSLLSRRQFLHVAGITLLNSGINLNQLWPYSLSHTDEITHARTFAATKIFARPHPASSVLRQLWPDSIVAITGGSSGWYHLSEGFIPRATAQPMLLHPIDTEISNVAYTPFLAEVASPVAAVREWASADAPLVTRIGYGGTVHIMDYLPTPDSSGWYALSGPDNTLLGWTQAVHWQRIEISTDHTFSDLHVEINQTQQLLTVYQQQMAILQTPVSINERLNTGVLTLKREQPCLPPFLISATNPLIYGAPWHLKVADTYDLCGVYWHNQFGQAAPGPHIQVTALVARWLYQHLSDNDSVTIV